jgi:hypothetical protein
MTGFASGWNNPVKLDRVWSSPKRLVYIAANSPANMGHPDGGVLVRFRPLSSFYGAVIRLAGITGHQLSFPLFANDHLSSISTI